MNGSQNRAPDVPDPLGEVKLSDAEEFGRALSRMQRWGLDPRVAAAAADVSRTPHDPQAWNAVGNSWDAKAAVASTELRGVTAAEWARQAFFSHRLAEARYVSDCDAKADAYTACLSSFDQAAAPFGERLRRIVAPFEGHELPGLLLLPSEASDGPVPAVLIFYGADGNKEEHLWASLLPYAERGIAAAAFDCPGQGWSRRVAGLTAIPDMERFASACVDVLTTQPEVDATRIGIAGSSLGGYYAPRSFAADDRFRACVINSAVYDVARGFWDSFPPIQAQLQYLTGQIDPADARAHYADFTLADMRPVDRPTRIFHGAEDRMIPPEQARLVAEAMGPAATLVLWPGGSHNLGSVGVEAHPTVWDWLVHQLKEAAP